MLDGKVCPPFTHSHASVQCMPTPPPPHRGGDARDSRHPHTHTRHRRHHRLRRFILRRLGRRCTKVRPAPVNASPAAMRVPGRLRARSRLVPPCTYRSHTCVRGCLGGCLGGCRGGATAMDTLKVEVEMAALALDEDPRGHFATVDQFLREWEAHSANVIDLSDDPSEQRLPRRGGGCGLLLHLCTRARVAHTTNVWTRRVRGGGQAWPPPLLATRHRWRTPRLGLAAAALLPSLRLWWCGRRCAKCGWWC